MEDHYREMQVRAKFRNANLFPFNAFPTPGQAGCHRWRFARPYCGFVFRSNLTKKSPRGVQNIPRVLGVACGHLPCESSLVPHPPQ